MDQMRLAKVGPLTFHVSYVELKHVEMDLPSIDCCSMVVIEMELELETETNLDSDWSFDADPIDNQNLTNQLFLPIDALISILFRIYHHLG